MKKIPKKEIRQIVESSVFSALAKLRINKPSKKVKKGLSKLSKEIARFLKAEVKRSLKHKPTTKAKPKKGKPVVVSKKSRKGSQKS